LHTPGIVVGALNVVRFGLRFFVLADKFY